MGKKIKQILRSEEGNYYLSGSFAVLSVVCLLIKLI